ncbi:D-amino-acid transaminase [Paenibacillus sp. MBLB4367]|uniref:D-amino-acid transaminase n=1 Tax=Paenibacillus sp. MBLB4367 TaxID=3384767 RepID=UPI00390832F6
MVMMLYKNQFVNNGEVRISPNDRGYYFGDGVYEVFRIYNGSLFEKDAHYRRLERSAEQTRIPLPYPITEIDEKLEKLLAADGVKEGIIYLQLTRGEAPRGHAFPNPPVESVLMAYSSELSRPHHAIRGGIRVITRPDIRWLRCDLKTLNLLPNVMAKQEAAEAGAAEVIFHRDGTVTECSSSNVMIIKDGTIRTHPANNLILHGITRAVVLKLAFRLNLSVREEAFTLEDLRSADEVFITSTTAEVTPVAELDGVPVADGKPGPVSRRLQEAFEAYMEG